MSTTIDVQIPHTPHSTDPGRDAFRDVLLGVQRTLAASWVDDQPRIAVVERDGLATVYVSTARALDPQVRSDIRGAVRAALAQYMSLAPYTNVVFLRRRAA
ncbi:hypothetical protein KGQ20_21025 [Catenulispora sp. NF23]|uniref:hypothetical protein n=1 Tax=Catenulispora pinistramenti TaxID=2705254 RepID=UPI001BAE22D7|nr:hypothetical protein [Catenulispora pinistramenti]MBS2535250.1 hypothetical protein [Catenulispora pinistramenti]